MRGQYVGRFAPSPTGPLHAGSIVAAVASYLDARAHQGLWLLRIEDIDHPRSVPGADRAIIDTLARLGMRSDRPVIWQRHREARYQQGFERLRESGWLYACGCTRREIADSQTRLHALAQEAEPIYPGTCRAGLAAGRSARSWRVKVDHARIGWQDRNGTDHDDDLSGLVGDFVVRRADGLWAYQLAVVIDDAEQGVTDVVRGADLTDSTARQIHLQQLLGLPRPRYLHLPVVLAADGRKLSKQNGAASVDDLPALDVLNAALIHLGLEAVDCAHLDDFWHEAVRRWLRSRWCDPRVSPRPLGSA
jgi:glutamyl-Q tRNA(Asp) synthetase